MTDDTEALLVLAERCEQASGPDRELDADIAALHFSRPREEFLDDALGRVEFGWQRHYTASLDAAMTLVPEGWNWMAGNRNQLVARAYVENDKPAFIRAGSRRNPDRRWAECTAATPALALCAAALRARASAKEQSR